LYGAGVLGSNPSTRREESREGGKEKKGGYVNIF
jgi:hypothetical protein